MQKMKSAFKYKEIKFFLHLSQICIKAKEKVDKWFDDSDSVIVPSPRSSPKYEPFELKFPEEIYFNKSEKFN